MSYQRYGGGQQRTPTCYRCGRPGHYSTNCNAKTDVHEDVCHRCGRPGHWESQCYAKTIVNNEGTYALVDRNGKRYVGTSVDIQRRVEQHKGNLEGGAKFTGTMQGLRRVRTLTEPEDVPTHYEHETHETLAQMDTYGMDNVRGAMFCNRGDLPERSKFIAGCMIDKTNEAAKRRKVEQYEEEDEEEALAYIALKRLMRAR